MRKAIFLFVALMVYAMWAAAQPQPSPPPNAAQWRAQFTAVPQGVVLATETPSPKDVPTPTYTPEPTYVPEMGPPSAWNNMPSPTPSPRPEYSIVPSPTPSPPTPTPTPGFTLVPDKGKKK